jgi:ankyrin repeat protein
MTYNEALVDFMKPKTKEEISSAISDKSPEEMGRKLIDASRSGQLDIVNILLDMGVDVNYKNKIGDTALILASYEGHTEIVRVLLEKGADPNIVSDDGTTAYKDAASYNFVAIMKLLKKYGAKR